MATTTAPHGETIEKVCLRCGHEWHSFLVRPQVCPRCKSYDWDKPRQEKDK